MAHLEWKTDVGLVNALIFDSVRSVEHQRAATATTHPVEKGADISDHVRVGLPTVSVVGYISRAPLSFFSSIGGPKDIPIPSAVLLPVVLPPAPAGGGAIKAASSVLQGGFIQAGIDALKGALSPSIVTSQSTIDSESRVSQVMDVLDKLMEGKSSLPIPGQKRKLLRFVDEAKTYEDMVLTHFTVTRTQQMFGCAVQFELQQIKTVASQLVAAPVPAEVRGQALKPAGASAAKKADDAVAEVNQSAALALAKGVFGFGGFKPPF